MVRKALGMDRILESIVQRLGRLELALLVGDYALGRDSGLIDLVLVGAIDQRNLADLIAKTERHLARKIRPLVLSGEEYASLADTLTPSPTWCYGRQRRTGQTTGRATPRPGSAPPPATVAKAQQQRNGDADRPWAVSARHKGSLRSSV
jgi:hypothetical protein